MTPSERRMMKRVEAGFAHSLPTSKTGSHWKIAMRLVERGWLRVKPPNAVFPERYVTTSAGSWALGTFDSTDQSFDEDSRAASRAARGRKAA